MTITHWCESFPPHCVMANELLKKTGVKVGVLEWYSEGNNREKVLLGKKLILTKDVIHLQKKLLNQVGFQITLI